MHEPSGCLFRRKRVYRNGTGPGYIKNKKTRLSQAESSYLEYAIYAYSILNTLYGFSKLTTK
jgi:hypothetical protein